MCEHFKAEKILPNVSCFGQKCLLNALNVDVNVLSLLSGELKPV